MRRVPEDRLIDKDITLKKVYKRDNGVCHICGMQCDWNSYHYEKGRFRPDEFYPVLDHVIPVAKGGEHSWENVKLAHWRCNLLKSDDLYDGLYGGTRCKDMGSTVANAIEYIKRELCDVWPVKEFYDSLKELGYSQATIRRAIEKLSKDGQIKRWQTGYGNDKTWWIGRGDENRNTVTKSCGESPICAWIITHVPRPKVEGVFYSYEYVFFQSRHYVEPKCGNLIVSEISPLEAELFKKYRVGIQLGVKSNGKRGMRIINLK